MAERTQALSPPLLARLSEFLDRRLGLHFPCERYGDLARGITSAAREFGHADVEACIDWLHRSALGREQVEILASHLTIGETYFFREREALVALEEHVLPPLIRARVAGERRLRIWSAGCCSGEEPYSIAMVLARALPVPSDWHISILATDINPQFLRKAAAGVYGEWSFRNVPAAIKRDFFVPLPDGRFRVLENVRTMVTFAYLNLAEDCFPAVETGTNAMDVIFCRNVLMYFAPQRSKGVLEKLGRCLVPGGVLFVNPVEISRSAIAQLDTVKIAGALAYRKNAGAALPAPVAVAAEPAQMPPRHDGPERATETAAAASQDAGDAGSMALLARSCANEGRLAEALAWGEKAVAADKLDSRWHYLLATILQEQGMAEQSAAALRRALYLNPECALAHFALGNQSRQQGRLDESLRHFRNALSVLAAYGDGDILPESEGLSAGRLAAIIGSTLSSDLPR